jgi:hypothetical protein
VLAAVRHLVQRLLVRRGLEPADDATGSVDRFEDESPVLAGIMGAPICLTNWGADQSDHMSMLLICGDSALTTGPMSALHTEDDMPADLLAEPRCARRGSAPHVSGVALIVSPPSPSHAAAAPPYGCANRMIHGLSWSLDSGPRSVPGRT